MRLLFSKDTLTLRYVINDSEPVHVMVVSEFEEKTFTDADFSRYNECIAPKM